MTSLILEMLGRPVPEKLWHYTSIEGFQRIVTSKRIFATDLRFLNDSEEFTHTLQLANEIAARTPILDDKGFPTKKVIDNAVKLTFGEGPVASARIYVACFTDAEDQLGQWRGYSHGSTGVSLGFNLKSLRPPAGTDTLVSFAPCEYDPSKKEELLELALRHVENEVRPYYERVFPRSLREGADQSQSGNGASCPGISSGEPGKESPHATIRCRS